MNMKLESIVFILTLGAFSHAAMAETAVPVNNVLDCLQNHQIIHESTAQAREYKVIYGPYTAHCATLRHRVQLRSKSGSALPVTIEKLQNGNWVKVVRNEIDPSKNLGIGTFRVILDRQEQTSHTIYKGYVKIPL